MLTIYILHVAKQITQKIFQPNPSSRNSQIEGQYLRAALQMHIPGLSLVNGTVDITLEESLPPPQTEIRPLSAEPGGLNVTATLHFSSGRLAESNTNQSKNKLSRSKDSADGQEDVKVATVDNTSVSVVDPVDVALTNSLDHPSSEDEEEDTKDLGRY